MDTPFLEMSLDKFTLRVKRGLLYHPDHDMWMRIEGDLAWIGVTDFLQLQSGDATHLDLPLPGADLVAGKSFGALETMKVALDLVSPATGRVVETNLALETAPEGVNEDPYGQGWLVKMQWSRDEDWRASLVADEEYFRLMGDKASMMS